MNALNGYTSFLFFLINANIFLASSLNILMSLVKIGARGSVVVKALHYNDPGSISSGDAWNLFCGS